MPRNERKSSPRKQSLTQDLIDLDGKLTALLVRRSELLAQSAAGRRDRRGKIAEPRQEKELWTVWKERRDESGIDGRIWEQLFNLSNGLAYARAENERQQPSGYVLSPRRSTVAIDIPGPRDLLTTRFALAMAAVSGQPLFLPEVVLNDPLIELIKGFNQAGGAISWDSSGVRTSSTSGLSFEGKVVFAGNDSLNLYILLTLCLLTTGTFKFTGATGLKTLDLTPLHSILAQLGARIVHLDPHSLGVPLRIEASGVTPTEVRLPETCPPEFAWALILTTAAMGRAMRILWRPDAGQAFYTGRLSSLLNTLNCAYSNFEGGIELSESGLTLPSELSIPLDPTLCGHVLSMPLDPGGKARLRGRWPAFREASDVALLLERFLDVHVTENDVSASSRKRGRSPDHVTVEYSPLAAALTLLAKSRDPGSTGTYLLVNGEEQRFFSDLGVQSSMDDLGRMSLEWTTGPGGPPPTIHAPTPEWAMSLALLSFHRSGMTLLNPGIVSTTWPQFWQIYNGLPNPTFRSQEQVQEKEDVDESSRRRKIVS
jgi:3-phosphoshikimate 1-carboxyvinyltransferase